MCIVTCDTCDILISGNGQTLQILKYLSGLNRCYILARVRFILVRNGSW